MLALLLLAQPVDLDLPPAEKQKRIAAIEARTEQTTRDAETLTAELGDTIFVEKSIPVNDASGELIGAARGVRAGNGISVAPWVEVVDQRPGAVVVLYAIEIAPDRATGGDTVEATIEVRDQNGDRVAKKSIAHELVLRAPAPVPEKIALDRDAVLHHRAVASRRGAEKHEIEHHRLRAEAARRRLVAAAGAEDRALELAAIRAIGSLSRRPRGEPKDAKAIDALTTEDALAKARDLLGGLMLDEAQVILQRVRRRLAKRELPAALQMLAAIELARGDEEEARRLNGQALCLDPGTTAALARRAFREAFETAKGANACREPIRISEVHVHRERGEDGLVYVVTASYADDPFGLVEGGDLEIWGTGGGLFAEDRVRSTEKNGQKMLIGTIADNGKMETYAGQILVKAFLRDPGGVVIDSYGDPDPVSLPIERGGNLSASSVPWWVWAIVGVAVAGAATATAIVLTRPDEDQFGIGPIEVTF